MLTIVIISFTVLEEAEKSRTFSNNSLYESIWNLKYMLDLILGSLYNDFHILECWNYFKFINCLFLGILDSYSSIKWMEKMWKRGTKNLTETMLTHILWWLTINIGQLIFHIFLGILDSCSSIHGMEMWKRGRKNLIKTLLTHILYILWWLTINIGKLIFHIFY